MNPKMKKQNTPNELLKAAKQLFACKGYAATSVKDISDVAGTNVSAISYHFGGKEELLARIFVDFANEGLKPSFRPIQKPADSLEEFKTRIDMLCHNLFDVGVKDRCAFVVCSANHNILQEMN